MPPIDPEYLAALPGGREFFNETDEHAPRHLSAKILRAV